MRHQYQFDSDSDRERRVMHKVVRDAAILLALWVLSVMGVIWITTTGAKGGW